MKTREEALALCMSFDGVYCDRPFKDANWQLVRHNENGKAFAMIFERNGLIWINCKGAPEINAIRREVYPAVVPAYHLNKVHWISVILDGSIDETDVKAIVSDSYRLTAKKQ